MTDETQTTTRARARLDAWRERGMDRLDPVRFGLLDALERRASRYGGDARRVLDARLDALVAAYADDVGRASSATAATGERDTQRETANGLADLNDYIANQARAARAMPRPGAWPELEMLDYFRKTWSRVSAERQVRQSRDQVPTNAGPLNSSSLVHRSLSLMRELSPGYLEQFLSYVDALSWMEQLNGGDAPVAQKETRRPVAAKKSAKSRSR
ncbi:DUF2894 domain-containing protein [Paraburkholderia caballeronis]|uniref:DUF2894 domain-containing protein n=1 Tax=Paraburkholderia caballeronis TaxID=416943 RepID=UPI0010646D8E|nr:DUF2894 domain-containing protein [Paraburkholderia caballeronis]